MRRSKRVTRFPHLQAYSGQATVEFLYVLPILLLLLLASLQFVFIYEAKQTLNYATFIGTREGALHNGSIVAIQSGLASGLAPLFVHGENQQALKDGRAVAKSELGNFKLAKIVIVNPTQSALNGLKNASGEIPNDNLMYRTADAASQKDGMNVQDANLLKVQVTYCVRLIVPIINRMIYGFAVAPPAAGQQAKLDGSYTGGTMSADELLKTAAPGTPTTTTPTCTDTSSTNAYPYRVPVTSEAVVRMQSPFKNPGTWTAP